ncbi:MAG: hypothetical protein AB8B64_07185 [Granulosicoccus sp.]
MSLRSNESEGIIGVLKNAGVVVIYRVTHLGNRITGKEVLYSGSSIFNNFGAEFTINSSFVYEDTSARTVGGLSLFGMIYVSDV